MTAEELAHLVIAKRNTIPLNKRIAKSRARAIAEAKTYLEITNQSRAAEFCQNCGHHRDAHFINYELKSFWCNGSDDSCICKKFIPGDSQTEESTTTSESAPYGEQPVSEGCNSPKPDSSDTKLENQLVANSTAVTNFGHALKDFEKRLLTLETDFGTVECDADLRAVNILRRQLKVWEKRLCACRSRSDSAVGLSSHLEHQVERIGRRISSIHQLGKSHDEELQKRIEQLEQRVDLLEDLKDLAGSAVLGNQQNEVGLDWCKQKIESLEQRVGELAFELKRDREMKNAVSVILSKDIERRIGKLELGIGQAVAGAKIGG